jgi:hypothetical protein
MSPGDADQFLLNNSIRAFFGFGSDKFIGHITIDLDYAWYHPWDAERGSAKNKAIHRQAGIAGGCRWI